MAPQGRGRSLLGSATHTLASHAPPDGLEMTVVGHDPRVVVHDLAAGMVPHDGREVTDKSATLRWVRSGAPFCFGRSGRPRRIRTCVYFALFDEVRRTVLLVDHVTVGLWLFPGGHVDDGADPRTTVLREAAEELRIDGEFRPWFGTFRCSAE